MEEFEKNTQKINKILDQTSRNIEAVIQFQNCEPSQLGESVNILGGIGGAIYLGSRFCKHPVCILLSAGIGAAFGDGANKQKKRECELKAINATSNMGLSPNPFENLNQNIKRKKQVIALLKNYILLFEKFIDSIARDIKEKADELAQLETLEKAFLQFSNKGEFEAPHSNELNALDAAISLIKTELECFRQRQEQKINEDTKTIDDLRQYNIIMHELLSTLSKELTNEKATAFKEKIEKLGKHWLFSGAIDSINLFISDLKQWENILLQLKKEGAEKNQINDFHKQHLEMAVSTLTNSTKQALEFCKTQLESEGVQLKKTSEEFIARITEYQNELIAIQKEKTRKLNDILHYLKLIELKQKLKLAMEELLLKIQEVFNCSQKSPEDFLLYLKNSLNFQGDCPFEAKELHLLIEALTLINAINDYINLKVLSSSEEKLIVDKQIMENLIKAKSVIIRLEAMILHEEAIVSQHNMDIITQPSYSFQETDLYLLEDFSSAPNHNTFVPLYNAKKYNFRTNNLSNSSEDNNLSMRSLLIE